MATSNQKKEHRIHRLFKGSITSKELDKLAADADKEQFEEEWFRNNWDKAALQTDNTRISRMWKNIYPTTQTKVMYRNWWGIAATAAFLIVSTLFISQQLSESFSTDTVVAIANGQQGTITLPDGTRVWLNAGTELSYGSRFNNSERIVELDGEAYFEVAKNPRAPFIVQSEKMHVKALGTAFNLKAHSEDPLYTLVLVEGEVEASDGTNRINLLPNQKINYYKSEQRMEKANLNDSQLFTNWRDGKFSFDSEPFSTIALSLERKFGVRMVFESSDLKSIRYSGTLEVNSLEEILNIMSLTSPLTYRITEQTVFLNTNTETIDRYLQMTRD